MEGALPDDVPPRPRSTRATSAPGASTASGSTTAGSTAAGSTAAGSTTAGPELGQRPGRHWSAAALFVAPYLVLMLVWAFTNPPAAAPDEPAHLIKALGMATFDIGSKYAPPDQPFSLGMQRNNSISRVIGVPANLAPSAVFGCELTQPKVSAGCIRPQKPVTATDTRYLVDPLGSYPPFLYPPMGWAARLGSDSAQAYLFARLFCVLASSLLLLLGSAHLIRSLGRNALLGAFVALTPTVIFCDSATTTSGIEIAAAFATACIVVVGIRVPGTLAERGTQLLLAGVGSTLILSRQLGVVTFALLAGLLLIRVGPTIFLNLLRRPRAAFVGSAGILAVAATALLLWERAYDHPVNVGAAFNPAAFGSYVGNSFSVLRSGVALFGWLDTTIPPWFVAAWVVVSAVLVGLAVLLGNTRDRWTILLWLAGVVLVGYFTYATVFYPVRASLQGRHLLAVFMIVPLLAGVVVLEQAPQLGFAVQIRLFRMIAVVMPVLQFVSIYLNGRRYAVGAAGPVWFLDQAQWSPALGWWPWLLVALGASAWLGRQIWTAPRSGSAAREPSVVPTYRPREPAHVER